MARATPKQSKKSEKEKDVVPRPSLLQDIGHDAVRVIVGILLILFGVLTGLSAFDLAGMLGEYLYLGLTYLFGVGFYIVPIISLVLGGMFFVQKVPGSRVDIIRGLGGVLFVFSLLGVIEVLSGGSGGIVGYGIAAGLVAVLEQVASLVVLVGLLLIALVLVFGAQFFTATTQAIGSLARARRTPQEEGEDSEPVIVTALPPDDEPAVVAELAPLVSEKDHTRDAELSDDFIAPHSGGKRTTDPREFDEYVPPPLSILERDRGKPVTGDTKANANLIKRTLLNFGIRVEMDEITVGPTVTRYALKPAEGVRLERIEGLQKNLELALAAPSLRIEAPIPGKSLVGIEVPNTDKALVGLGRLLEEQTFIESPKPLLVALGRDITGSPHFADISKMPHALVAGATGAGKSVTIHALITSLLYRNGPERLRLILVDPKRVELTLYNGIPHLLTPVITDAKKTIAALRWAGKEMERRLQVFSDLRVRDIASYHSSVLTPALEKAARRSQDGAVLPERMPHIVIMIDELADIMQTYPRELEAAIVRLAQMARATGIHLILSTQRPSVNVITGLIKANVPFRVALQVASQIDSRTILDQPGAEKLLGAGDMLYLAADMSKPRRLQSPFITESEVKKVVQFLTKHNDYVPDAPLDLGPSETSTDTGIAMDDMMPSDGGDDDIFEEARQVVITEQKASTSLLQRKLSIGYGRAARIMDLLEERGVIGPQNGSKAREVLVPQGTGFSSSEEL